MYNEKKMLNKLLKIFCHFNYHPKTRLVEVKIGFGPSDKVETVECQICQKVFIRGNKGVNPKIVLIIILLLLLVILFF